MIATVAGALMFSTSSCSKETTCECTTFEIQEDGTKVKQGDTETRVVEEEDADCTRFDKYNDNTITNDTSVECEEKVFD